jgi:nitrous oxide reductase accessory protein NosL
MSFLKPFKILILITVILNFTACEKKITTEIKEIHWDRDMCSRCVMVVSDRNQTVQVINPKDGKSYVFDDIGCAFLWFKDQDIQWKDDAIIWINDIKTAKWINARTAFYDTMNITPMAYGYGAHEGKDTIQGGLEIIDFNEVEKRVLEIGK